MAHQSWVSALEPHHIADGTAYTGTAAIGDISPAPSIVIPANFLGVGSRLEFSAATAPAVLTFDSTIAHKVMIGATPSVTTGSWQVHYFGVRSVN